MAWYVVRFQFLLKLFSDLLQCVQQAVTSMIEHNLSHQLCSRPDISTDTDCGHHSCYRGRYIILFSPDIGAVELLKAVTEHAFFRV